MSDSVFGFIGADYVLLACDTLQARSIVMMKTDEDKTVEIDSHKVIAASGPQGDRAQFGEYVKRNIILYQLRQNVPLSTHAAANFTRGELAEALRKGPYQVNMLFGGFDKQQGPSLYWIDYLASLQKVEFGCHGYAGHFLLGIFDKQYKTGMTLEEGFNLAETCITQLKTRFLLNQSKWIIKVIDKNGHRVLHLPNLTPDSQSGITKPAVHV